MFRHILMPVDLSDQHQAALKMVRELCTSSGGEIVLLHVIEQIAGLSVDEERPFYGRLERLAREHLEKLGKQLDAAKVRWRSEVRLGPRVRLIAEYADEMKADLIVLTSPRADPANVWGGLGSLSFRVGLVAPCPVLFVR